MKILVTGASGFVGSILCRHLAAEGHQVVAGLRNRVTAPGWMDVRVYGDLENSKDFKPVVDGVDAIVHLAARVHMMGKADANLDAVYRHANVDLTSQLAEAAAVSGVTRFVFLSSVKANGERTGDRGLTERDTPAPEDAYSRSKLEAEQALEAVSSRSGLTCTSLRVPLVYGPGVGANFAALMRLCDMSIPLPLAGITTNRRSLLFAGNLVSAIGCVLECPTGNTGTYLLSDGEDLSTADLVKRLRHCLNRRIPDLPVPAGFLQALAGLAGKKAASDRLCGSLQLDPARFRQTFDWTPPFSVDQGLAATAAWRRTRH